MAPDFQSRAVSSPVALAACEPPRVLWALSAADRERFFGPELDRIPAKDQRIVDPTGRDWEKILADSDPEVLAMAWGTPPLPGAWAGREAGRLRYVCHVNGSVRRQVPRQFLERGGRVTNWGSAATYSVAEHAVLLVLGSLREAGKWRQAITGSPPAELRTKPLAGRRVGLHGFGRIAVRIAQLLQPFAVELRAFSTGVPHEVFRREGVQPCESLASLFAWSDVLIECEALTSATEESVTAELLGRMPDDAVFVNVGRGRVVDEAALAAAGRAGRLRIAVDVMAKEPASERSPLCLVPGAWVSPHLGGPTHAEFRDLGAAALANVRRYCAGQPLQAEVTLEHYDRTT